MGKMILAVVLSLIVVSSACLLSARELHAALDPAISLLSRALDAQQSGDTASALAYIRQAHQHWDDHTSRLCMLLHHTNAEAADGYLVRCEYALLFQEPMVFLESCRTLLDMLSKLLESGRLTWANLL